MSNAARIGEAYALIKRERDTAASEKLARAKRQAAREAAEDARGHNAAKRLKVVLAELISHAGSSRAASRALDHESPSILAGWQKGGTPDPRNLVRISQATGCSVDWLCGFDVPREREPRELVGSIQMLDLRRAVADFVKTQLRARGVPAGALASYQPTDLLLFLVEQTEERVLGTMSARREASVRAMEAGLVRLAKKLAGHSPEGLTKELAYTIVAQGADEASEDAAEWRQQEADDDSSPDRS